MNIATGLFIRSIRKSNKMTISDLSKKTGISKKALSNLEIGTPPLVNLDILKKVADSLSIDINLLLSFESRLPLAKLSQMASKDPYVGVVLRYIAFNTDLNPKDVIDILITHLALRRH